MIAYEISGPTRQLTGCSRGEARVTDGVEVDVSVAVGSSANASNVSIGIGVSVTGTTVAMGVLGSGEETGRLVGDVSG
jgi:hypothetical protein